jgi:hypothetical protein
MKTATSGVNSEDSCYGSHDLSRSSSSTHGVARPLLTLQDRSPSLSSTSVEYGLPIHRQIGMYESKNHTTDDHVNRHLSIEHIDENLSTHGQYLNMLHTSLSSHKNFRKTIQSLTRRPMTNLHSTYLTYDSIDTPLPLPFVPPMDVIYSKRMTSSSTAKDCSMK